LIFSGQLTKNEALVILDKPFYENEQVKKNEVDFVLKKLGFSIMEFEALLKKPRVEHEEFGQKKSLLKKYPFLKLLRPLKKLIVRN
jgi:hypothetical protein